MRQGVYALDRVEPLPAAAGTARVAETAEDRELALRWWIAFGAEVLHEGGPGHERAEVMVDHRLSSPTGGILLWADEGEPVSLAAWGGPTPNGIRVGPVYTPPELRGRGYATAVTAELSRRLLDGTLFEGGRRFCFLYTDLANPTSNAIYERIGYHQSVRVSGSCLPLTRVTELRGPESGVSGPLRAVCLWVIWTRRCSGALARGRGRRERSPACG